MEIFLGIVFGVLITYYGMSLLNRKKGLHQVEKQSVVLIEKIKTTE